MARDDRLPRAHDGGVRRDEDDGGGRHPLDDHGRATGRWIFPEPTPQEARRKRRAAPAGGLVRHALAAGMALYVVAVLYLTAIES